MSPEWLLNILIPFDQYKYLILFLIAFLEGPIISIISGFLASVGFLNVFIVYPLLILGDILGDLTYYSIGRFWGHLPLAKRIMRPFGYSPNVEKKVEGYLNKHTGKTLVFAKFSYGLGLGATSQVASGIAKVPFYRFFFWVTVATLPKSLLLLLIGYYAGHSFAALSGYLHLIPFITLAFAGGLIFLYVTVSKLARKFFRSTEKEKEEII